MLIAALEARRENHAVPTTEGKLIRKWRVARKLTQEQLGSRCVPELGKTSIANYERGDNSMGVSNLVRIINALDVPGATEEARLARFFQGPAQTLLEETIAALRAERRSDSKLLQLLSRLAEGRVRDS